MTDGPGTEAFNGAVRALRYTLAVLGESDRQAGGGSPEDAVPVSMTADEAVALAPALAFLVIAARRALAENLGIDGPEAQAAWARAQLQGELESHEMNAAFADVEAEVKGAGA